MRKLKLISILTPHNCKVCSRLTKFSRKSLQKLLSFWNKKTMRKNLERNPILRKQQSQRKRFPTLQQSNRINLAVKLWTQNLKKNLKKPLKIPEFYKMKPKLKFKSQLNWRRCLFDKNSKTLNQFYFS